MGHSWLDFLRFSQVRSLWQRPTDCKKHANYTNQDIHSEKMRASTRNESFLSCFMNYEEYDLVVLTTILSCPEITFLCNLQNKPLVWCDLQNIFFCVSTEYFFMQFLKQTWWESWRGPPRSWSRCWKMEMVKWMC